MRLQLILIGLVIMSYSFKIGVINIEDPQQCIEEKCPNQWANCQKDPKCGPALKDCQKKCGTGKNCWTLCLGGKGSQAAIDVAKCADANHCLGVEPSTELAIATPQQCIQDKCPNQLNACRADSKCFPAIQDCEIKCKKNQTCFTTCIAGKGDPAATDLWKCIVDNDCLNAVQEIPITAIALADPQQCIEEKCPNQWANCQKDPKCGPALKDCQKKCGTGKNCWTLCLGGKGSQAAIDVAKCADANHCLGVEPSTELAIATPQQCIQDKCPNQLNACRADSKCFPAIQDCEIKCKKNQTCFTTCIAGKGDPAATDLWKCIVDNDCLNAVQEIPITAIALADPQQCIEEKCPNQWANCQKDPKCGPALKDCQKKCGTGKNCWTLCLGGKGSQAAIDVAKCADANHCLGSSQMAQIQTYGFETCMSKSCFSSHIDCLSNSQCRASLRKCRLSDKIWEFKLECLLSQSQQSDYISSWVKCGGEHKCL